MFGLKTLRQPYINAKLGSKKGTLTRVLERPGMWMAPDELQKIVTDLRTVIDALGIGGLDYGIAKGNKETLDNAILTIIYDGRTGKPMAFNALSIMNCSFRGKLCPVVHLGLVVIDPNIRSKGLSWILYGLTTFLLFFKNRMKPIWISNVTQVPAIVGMVSESFGNVFPNPRLDSRRTYDHLVLAKEILKDHRHVFGVGSEAEFDEEHFVIKNAYTGGSDNLKKTFEQAPKHRTELYNQYCEKHLDYQRGDDFLQLGQIDLRTFYHYLLHSVPKESVLATIYSAGLVLFESFLVPAFQWFATDRQMGVLRPRRERSK